MRPAGAASAAGAAFAPEAQSRDWAGTGSGKTRAQQGEVLTPPPLSGAS